MPKLSRNVRQVLLWSLTFISLVMGASVHFRFWGTLYDPFHYGEYFAALNGWRAGIPGFEPITLHGALDVLPGWLALHLFGEDRYIFPTWLAYPVLTLVSSIILVGIVAELTHTRRLPPHLLIATGLIAPMLVGYRDTALLLSIYTYLRLRGMKNEGGRVAVAAMALGAFMSFGLFWSYDRGLTGAVAISLACLLRIRHQRLYHWVLATFLVLTTLLFSGCCSDLFAWKTYFHNLSFLIDTAFQWRYEWSETPLRLTLFVWSVNVFAATVLLSTLVSKRLSLDVAADTIVWLLVSAAMLRIATNRADIDHAVMGLWAPWIMLLYGATGEASGRWRGIQSVTLFFLACVVLVFGAAYPSKLPAMTAFALMCLAMLPRLVGRIWWERCTTAGLSVSLLHAALLFSTAAFDGQYKGWQPGRFWPANPQAVSDGIRWVAGELVRSGTSCVFDLTNSGLINAVSGLPACSRITYPVYATPAYESELMEAIRYKHPPAVVYSGKNWPFVIDKRTTHDRFPNLTGFLREQYPEEKCRFNYCIRFLEGSNNERPDNQ